MRVEQVASRYGRAVQWRPFVLGAIFRAQGWNDSPFNIYPAKGRYMWRDLERVCASMSIPFRKPSQFPRSSLLAARIACVAESDWLSQFVQNVYTANFAKDLDIAQPAVLLDCLEALVSDPAAVLAAAHSAEAKSQLRRNTAAAIELGIFGAPTFVIDGDLFWGNDRLENALEWRRDAHGAG